MRRFDDNKVQQCDQEKVSKLSFPSSENSCPCNSVDSKSKGPHAEVTVVCLAHLLHAFEASSHVCFQLSIDLVFIPHESLDVLSPKKEILIFNLLNAKVKMQSLMLLFILSYVAQYYERKPYTKVAFAKS